MELTCYFNSLGSGVSHKDFYIHYCFHEIFKTLITTYPEINFKWIDSNTIGCKGNSHQFCKYGVYYMIIENDENKKFIIISYSDKIKYINGAMGLDMSKCIDIITSSGVHHNDNTFQALNVKYVPFTYILYTKHTYDNIIKIRQNEVNRVVPDKPNFMGSLYNFRKYLLMDNRFEVGESSLNNYDYLNKLNSYSLNLSLNGAAEICIRDMEIMGIGSALIRPKLTTKFHNELIPNYHYISVDLNEIKTKRTGNFYDGQANLILKRWNEVKDDKDFINFISENGKKWFDENVPIEKHGKIALNVINLKKLI